MNEITKLDDKYLVLKWDDIKALEGLEGEHLRLHLDQLIGEVQEHRFLHGKPSENKYLILNLDDEIDLSDFFAYYELIKASGSHIPIVKVSDIAIIFVNAILKAKEKNEGVRA